MSKKVLIITCYFPPSQCVASLRLRGLAKYLPEHGWDPIILTPALPGKPEQQYRVIETSYSENVIIELKKKLKLKPHKRLQEMVGIPFAIREGRRSFTNRLESFVKGIIHYPSKKRGWCPHAIKAGSELMKNEKMDAIISTSPPEITHLIANELKRRFNIPWVVDFRDLWTQNPYYIRGPVEKWFERGLEIKTLSQADALVTVSKPLVEQLVSFHKEKPVFEIRNGFDPEQVQSVPLTKEFTITYTGGLYRGRRDPRLLFQALRELANEKRVDLDAFRIRFFGPPQYWIEQEIKEYKLEKEVCQLNTVPRDVAIAKQRETQLLLLLNWNDPKEKGVYTGKVFEYLAAKRPILAVGGPKSVVSKLMKETNSGIHTSSLPILKDALVKYYKEYKANGKVLYHGKEEELNKHTHVEMARKYSEVLNSLKA
ncbi:MAG: glycosyltransferase [Planctomycetota bacterium]